VSDNPYRPLPDHCFWRRAIAGVAASDVDPVVRPKFRITRKDRIATAGSCFAQHIARHLTMSGFNYFVTETAHPLIAHLAGDYNYGLFTARYGNIYTSRQLVQTIKRAYGEFTPQDNAWPTENGRMIDPYRPQIQPNGFASLDELVADREQHFAAIRQAIAELDVFVFTLGLTETWFHRADGAVYPLCPGVAGGVFDKTQHGFVNLGVADVIADLAEAIDLIRLKNSNARVILTVSPVPLIATMEDRSVLASTTYSKSVLRVAAEEIAAKYDEVAYFPSYEVVTGNYSRGRYFDEGLRDVTEEGVSHVMRLFMKHYADEAERVSLPQVPRADDRQQASEQISRELAAIVAVMCDEVSLDTEATNAVTVPALSLVRDQERCSAAEGKQAIDTRHSKHSAWDVLTRTAPSAAQPRPVPSPVAQRPTRFWSRFGWRS
jgi:hypothetical protein